jgi:polysaccharide export outer membrane protein
MARVFKLFLLWAAVLTALSGCRTPKNITYFQDLKTDTVIKVDSENKEIKLQEGDKVSIFVSCRDESVAKMFNLLTYSQSLGNSYSQRVAYYTVDGRGEIDFPIIGKIYVKGLNRTQVCDTVKEKLISSEMIQEPVVNVEFISMYFDILGEIARPGRYTIDKDKMTLLDALGMAGDLSILGQRCNVKIIRNEDGGRKVYEIDMTSGNSVLNSPVFYIQQNDVLYVEANNYRKRQSIVAGNTVMTPSFWMSVASFLTSMYVIWVK